MSLLVGGSILAAFFAGSVALFSPCCIVFLLPAYLASAVKERRWALFPLTLVFAAGLAVVILPLTLGVGMLASTLTRFHTGFYLAGGVLMLALGALAFTGRSWSIPGLRRSPALDRSDVPGVFTLGVFSGIASSCCAPVLAGVVTLSALAGSLWGSAALGLAYVFGMVFPLFLVALVWDRLRLGERRFLAGREIAIRLGRRVARTTTVNLVVAGAFTLMGAGVIVLAVTGAEATAPGFQLAIGRWLSRAFGWITDAVKGVPEPLLGLGLVALAAVIAWMGVRGARTGSTSDETKESCHGTEEQREEEAAFAAGPEA
ncbi:MAG TPA: cytochrome c biogenesis CcdA family protein [Actinomycetota bacterium]